MIQLEIHSNKSFRLIPSLTSDINLFDLSEYLLSLELAFIGDIIPCKTELMVCFNSEANHDHQIELIEKIKQFSPYKITPKAKPSLELKASIFKTKDLDTILESKDLSISKFVQLLNASNYQLDMFGFLPGFMYIEGLNNSLTMPRKETPTTQCPPNSLAIGGPYLGVYKYPSPAGWNIIGTIEHLPELKELHNLQRGSSIKINFSYEPKD